MGPADESEGLHSFAPSQPARRSEPRRVFDVPECLMSAAGVHRAERKRRGGKGAAAENVCSNGPKKSRRVRLVLTESAALHLKGPVVGVTPREGNHSLNMLEIYIYIGYVSVAILQFMLFSNTYCPNVIIYIHQTFCCLQWHVLQTKLSFVGQPLKKT